MEGLWYLLSMRGEGVVGIDKELNCVWRDQKGGTKGVELSVRLRFALTWARKF